jgi:hypothetical protein
MVGGGRVDVLDSEGEFAFVVVEGAAEPLRIKELDHAGIEKVEQPFLAMLQLPRRKSTLESRTRPKAVGKPVQPVVE